VGIPFSVIVDGNAYPSTDKGFWSTGIQPVFKLKTTQGYNITATADHQILTQSGNWVELQHLKEGDQLRVNSSYNYTSGSAPFTATVSSIEYLGLEEVFDCTINDLHAFDANGLIAHNCLEVLLKNQGSCLLAHVNLGALQIDDIPRAFVEGMEWLCTLHKYTNVHLGGYYLPPSIDKQVGLGVLGLANLLAIEGITYHDLVVSMEELFNMVPEEDTTVPSKEARRLAIVLYEAFQMSARVARKYKMDRCVTANTWIHTIEGPKQVSDLIGIPFTAVVNGLPYESTKHGFWSTGVKPVYRITTTTGYSLTLTDNHPVLVNKKASKTCPKCRIPTTVIRKNGGGKYKNVVGICKSCNYHFKIGQEKPLNNNVWIEVKDLTIGDRLCLNNHRISPEWEGAGGTFEQGWLLGQLLGNGCLHDRSSDNRQATARLQFWGEYKEEMLDKCINYLNTSVDSRFVNSRLKGTKGVDSLYVRSTGLATLAKSVGMMPKQKVLNNSIEKMSSNFYRGFLQGLFDADGSVNLGNSTGSSRKISLAQVNKDTLRCVQRMLLRLGVVSKIYTNSKLSGDSTILLDNGKTHTIKTNNLLSNLIITGDDMIQYASLVGFSKPDKKQKLANMLLSYKQQPNSQSFITEVKSIELIGTEEVYDCTINEAHEFDANGLRVHNCFVVAPTASCSFNNKDREFYTTTPEIAPPVDVIVERDSQTMGVIEVDYHPDCETAEQVGWDVYFRLNCVWQRFMDSTGLAHAISTNWWSDKVRMDKDFIAQWLDSPLKSLYYAWQVSTNTQDKSEVITFDETETESSSTECLPCKELARQQNTECLSCAE
jgi:intein/homing endonuclease